ncbi:putative tricarboxylic transport membrane protein [Homoserinimonas aerilata]|uniref:Putative tricarboxylic transport membrane protein n=1 Tax=Homoserinimonas aerilata TaxID=1162970 RepID=A0A542YJW6_9MICO|nr:tripartite tricarboxylate transporter TctB family protein [Homoserinimonas aerilata]TQL48369.1 putative tricarboxylic transport membrane protein [Homoserinimonas aerilata]
MEALDNRPAGGDSSPAGRPRVPIGEYAFAGVTAAVGVYVLVAAAFIRVPVSSTSLGPKAFPYLVGALLLVAALAVLVGIRRGRLGEAEDGEDVDSSVPTDWLTVGKLLAFFIAHAYLVGLIGWPLAATVLFAGAAWTLGAAKLWRTILIGLALSLAIQFLFGSLLGLSLPAGPLLDWIPFL